MGNTLSNIQNNTVFALNQHIESMAKLQEQAASGSRINRPSDSPSNGYRLLGLNSQKRSYENYINNISEAIGVLEMSSTIFTSVVESLNKANEVLASVTDTDGTIGNNIHPEVIEGCLEDIVALANKIHSGNYLFGGSDTDSAPYNVERENGKIVRVVYQGSDNERRIQVAPGVQSSVYRPGSDLFRSDERKTPVFPGNTGAKAGTGTSSITGYVWLDVSHDELNHQYVLSIDGGLSEVRIADDGSAPDNVAITDQRTGKTLYVDGKSVNKAGVDLIRVPGTHDVFDVLITLRDILANSKNLSSAQVEQMRNQTVDALKEVTERITQNSVEVGTKIEFLDNLKGRLEDIKFNNEQQTADIQQADIAELSIELSKRQTLYQLSLAITGKLLSLSLVDFMT